MVSCAIQILLWCLLVTIFIVGIMIWIGVYIYDSANTFNILLDKFLNNFEPVDKYCRELGPITYREQVNIPTRNGYYEQKLAVALLDICFAVSNANCVNILPIPNPPGFTNQLRVEGPDPISKDTVMLAYIFWNETTRMACFCFSATFFNYQWNSDFQFQQVAPVSLQGYQDGVLVHQGFSDIYFTVRQQLWEWWVANGPAMDTLYITGHSSAGAISTICTYDFAQAFGGSSRARNSLTGDAMAFQTPVHYSFAAPASGNVKYAEVFNQRVPTSLRINNTSDIVLALPLPAFEGYIYQQTGGNVPFTASMTNIRDDHIAAYFLYMPLCPDAAMCTPSPITQ